MTAVGRVILITGPSPGLVVTAKILAVVAAVWLACWLAERALERRDRRTRR